MTILLIIVHILASLFLIAVVLLQSGKGAEIGAAFGGSSQTLFGSRGAASFLSKMTTVAAIVFMITALTLAVVTSRGGSVVKKAPVTQEQKSIPASGPVQSGEAQSVQPSQQRATQTPKQQLPQTQQQKPQQQSPQPQQQIPATQQQTPTK